MKRISYTSLPMAIINTGLKTCMILYMCGNSALPPEVLLLTNHMHGGTALANSQVKNKADSTTKLPVVFHR